MGQRHPLRQIGELVRSDGSPALAGDSPAYEAATDRLVMGPPASALDGLLLIDGADGPGFLFDDNGQIFYAEDQ